MIASSLLATFLTAAPSPTVGLSTMPRREGAAPASTLIRVNATLELLLERGVDADQGGRRSGAFPSRHRRQPNGGRGSCGEERGQQRRCDHAGPLRSEERRVGKEWRLRA